MIWRPSVIAGGMSEPLEGWTDTLSAAGAPMLVVSLGLVSRLNMEGLNHFDMVPVDYVTNGLLISTAYAGSSDQVLEIYNCGTSHVNPLNSRDFIKAVLKPIKYSKF